MYSMNDYRQVLQERDSHELNSKEWDFCQMKVNSIIAAMVADRSPQMVMEVVDGVYSLNDCGVEFDDPSVQWSIWLLESNGFKDRAQYLRELDWE